MRDEELNPPCVMGHASCAHFPLPVTRAKTVKKVAVSAQIPARHLQGGAIGQYCLQKSPEFVGKVLSLGGASGNSQG